MYLTFAEELANNLVGNFKFSCYEILVILELHDKNKENNTTLLNIITLCKCYSVLSFVTLPIPD